MKQLRSLNLSRNHFRNEFIARIVPILQVTRIQVLDLSCNSLSDEGLLYLTPYLKGNQHLRDINLNYSKFKAETPASSLSEALATCARLEKISLKLCRIEDGLVKHMVQMITPKLKILNMSHNKLTKEGITPLAEHLTLLASKGNHPTLQILSLKSNELNDFCIEAIRDIVFACRELRTFDISENLFYTSWKDLAKLKFDYKINFKE